VLLHGLKAVAIVAINGYHAAMRLTEEFFIISFLPPFCRSAAKAFSVIFLAKNLVPLCGEGIFCNLSC
jgi:hypothetical protein